QQALPTTGDTPGRGCPGHPRPGARSWAAIAAAGLWWLTATAAAAPASGIMPASCRPSPEAIAEFRMAETGRIAADRQRTEALARRLLGTGVSLAFSQVRERVPIYGDWAYGSVESYVTSYELV